MVGVVSLVTAAPPPSIVRAGGRAPVNRIVAAATVTASRDSARPPSWVLAPRVMAPNDTIEPERHAFAPVPAAPSTTQSTLDACAPPVRVTPTAAPGLQRAPVLEMHTSLRTPHAPTVRVPA